MRVYWYDAEKTILIRELQDNWEWDEYQLGVLLMRQMIKEVSHDIFVIIDGQNVRTIPKDAIHHFQAANRYLPSHVKVRVLISTNRLAHEIYSILKRISTADFENFYFVASMDEALLKIAERIKPLSS